MVEGTRIAGSTLSLGACLEVAGPLVSGRQGRAGRHKQATDKRKDCSDEQHSETYAGAASQCYRAQAWTMD